MSLRLHNAFIHAGTSLQEGSELLSEDPLGVVSPPKFVLVAIDAENSVLVRSPDSMQTMENTDFVYVES